MTETESQEKENKKNLLSKLPKLGRVSQFMLLVGIFLILLIPIFVIYQQQLPKQAGLEHKLTLLNTILSASTTKKESLEIEIQQTEARMETAETIFPSPDQCPEIIDRLIELAELSDIGVTATRVSTSEEMIGEDDNVIRYPILTVEIDLEGQVPKFQNFILSLDEKFPTCEIKELDMAVAEEETEEDTANLKIDILCYQGGE